jgi:uncharacterized protein
MKSALINLVVTRPPAVIVCVLAVTALFALGLRRGLVLDVSPLMFVAERSGERADYEAVRRTFGDDQYLVVALAGEDVFAGKSLVRLRELHARIEGLDGVAEALSLANAPYARSLPRGVALERLVPDPSGASPERLEEARRAALGDKLYAGHLVSRDARTAAINVLFKGGLATDERHAVTRQIYELAKGAGFAAVYFAGDPFTEWHATEALKGDLWVFLPLTVLLVAFLLWLCFRAAVAVVLPLVTVGVGLIWVFGLMALTGAHFTVIALMLPTLLLAVGCSYVIHVFNQVGIEIEESGLRIILEAERRSRRESGYESGRGSGRAAGGVRLAGQQAAVIAEALGFISLPVIVSALTIIAGFLSLAFTSIPGVRTTALFAAFGAFSTLVLSLTFVPAALVLAGRWALNLRVGLDSPMAAWLERVGRFAVRRQRGLYVVTGLLCAASLAGVWRIAINIDFFRFFTPHAETSVGVREVGRRLAGAAGFEVIVEAARDGALETPAALARIAELQTFAEAQGVGQTLSVVEIVRHVNRAAHGNDPQHYSIPTDAAALSDLLSDREQLRRFITDDGRRARVLVRSTLTGSAAMSRAVAELERKGRELLPDFRVYATGTVVLLNRTSDAIAREQLQSVTIALLTIYAMLALLFRSWRVGLTALVPNLIPVLFFFGFMGWAGIALNLTTSLVASVVLGLAVDNAVQFIVRFRRVLPGERGVRAAIIESLRLSGRPIIYANVALASAFAVFAFSNFGPVKSFGLLSAVTILGCLVEDLVLLPARLTSPLFRARESVESVENGEAGR